jgi:uncharacterized protein (DUF3820 family)
MRFTDIEQKLIRLALNHASEPGEISGAAVKLIEALRRRAVTPEEMMNGSAASSYSPPPRNTQTQQMTMEQALAYRMTFGKYKGQPLGEIRRSYLHWLNQECENKPFQLERALRVILNNGNC